MNRSLFILDKPLPSLSTRHLELVALDDSLWKHMFSLLLSAFIGKITVRWQYSWYLTVLAMFDSCHVRFINPVSRQRWHCQFIAIYMLAMPSYCDIRDTLHGISKCGLKHLVKYTYSDIYLSLKYAVIVLETEIVANVLLCPTIYSKFHFIAQSYILSNISANQCNVGVAACL